MKKLLLIALVLLSSAVTFTACTEEEVDPKFENTSGGQSSDKGF